jgi:hypothetical protein
MGYSPKDMNVYGTTERFLRAKDKKQKPSILDAQTAKQAGAVDRVWANERNDNRQEAKPPRYFCGFVTPFPRISATKLPRSS